MGALKKLGFILSTASKRNFAIILTATFLVGFIEMLTVASILPFMAVVSRPEVVTTNQYLSAVYNFLQFTDVKYFMFSLGLGVFIVLVLGNAFASFTSWILMRFGYNHGRKVACQLLDNYLSQPYRFFLERNRSDLAKNILAEVDRFVTGILINGIQSFSKLIVMGFLFGLLLIVDFKLALTVLGVLGVSYLLVYTVIRTRLTRAGKVSSAVNTIRYQLINESLGAIKELKVLGREGTFLKSFSENAHTYAKAETLSQLSPLIVRYLIEAIAFGGILLIALYLILVKEDVRHFMPLLGLYALAGYRLLPAMQQVFTGASLFRYHFSALEILHAELRYTADKVINSSDVKLPFQQNISLEDISFSYGQAMEPVISNLNLNLEKNKSLGIVGSSGAGKTTLVDIILGLLSPTSGELKIDNIKITKHNVAAWQKNIGYVPQTIFLTDDTIEKNIALGVKDSDIDFAAVERAVKLANLEGFIKRQAKGLQTIIGDGGVRLSGGQRQRVGIARALYHDPSLLIFDEATSSLDGKTEKVIIEAIRALSQDKTIIIIAHRLNTVKYCDEIIVLGKQNIVGRGSYHQLLETNSSFQKLAVSVTN